MIKLDSSPSALAVFIDKLGKRALFFSLVRSISLSAAVLLLTLLMMLGCSKDNFAKYNQLGDLRVLALIVDQPEVSPGATVNITPVLSDMNGAGRALNYNVQACIDPGIGVGATPSCPAPDSSNMRSGSVTIPSGSSQTYTDAVASFPITTPDNQTILALRNQADRYNGVAYLVFYTLASSDGSASVSSFVRVIVSSASKTNKNQNPTISSINSNDSSASSPLPMPAANTNFSVSSPASSVETYQLMTSSGDFKTQTETLINTWFSSDGTFDFQRNLGSTENSWSPPSLKPASRGLVFMVITRDSHNGATYRKLELN